MVPTKVDRSWQLAVALLGALFPVAAHADEEAVAVPWPWGQLASISCIEDSQAIPLWQGHCHYGDYTGQLVTYHENGAASAVLSLRHGFLDGLVERYDKQGNLIERLVFRAGVAVPPAELARLAGQPLGPPEPRPSSALPADIRGAGPPGRFLPRAPHRLWYELGIAFTVLYGHSDYASFTDVGSGSLLYLLLHAHRRLAIELDLAFMPNWGLGQRTYDWTVFRGALRVPLRDGGAVPYLVGGASLVTSEAEVPGADPNTPTPENAWYLGLDGGFGVSIPFGSQFALSVDARFGRNFRIDGGEHVLAPDDAGVLREILGSYYTVATNISLGVRF